MIYKVVKIGNVNSYFFLDTDKPKDSFSKFLEEYYKEPVEYDKTCRCYRTKDTCIYCYEMEVHNF